MPDFTIGERDFLLDGEPFRIISGALHYFRVHPELWADRIRKARLMGLNTIETYIAWNAHSPERGTFSTEGGLDIVRFLELVHAEGMYAIVRPGPYICAEWDNGGLPAWLFANPGVGIRRHDPAFMADVGRYFEQLLPLITPLQAPRGGPVILVQVENEYGAYGRDKDYLRALVDLTRMHGITVPLTTIDQPTDQMLSDGSLPGLHKTGSFGSRSRERLATLRRNQPSGPLMCAEFWDGWFDSWGAHHHTTPVSEAADELDQLLASGASVNIYMFHGGTNFGFTNGANDKGTYQPTVTSYDYDAPLSEDGRPTEKYFAFKEVISRYAPVPDEDPAPGSSATAVEVSVTSTVPLAAVLTKLDASATRVFDRVPTTDEIGHYSGFSLYTSRLPAASARVLSVGEVRDRAQVFVDGVPVGTMSRDRHESSLSLPAGPAARIDVLVEDQGRVNYGPRLGEHKGLIGPVDVNGSSLDGWRLVPIDLDRAADLAWQLAGGKRLAQTTPAPGPVFVTGSFRADTRSDLHLDTRGLGKGSAFVNGVNLGRYWSAGPQQSLYIPGPVLREGQNDVVLFELQAVTHAAISLRVEPLLGHVEA